LGTVGLQVHFASNRDPFYNHFKVRALSTATVLYSLRTVIPWQLQLHQNHHRHRLLASTVPRTRTHTHTHTQIDHAIQSQCPLLSIFPFRGMQLATRRSGTSFIRLGSNQHQHRQLDDDIVVVVTRPCTTLVASRVVLATCASVTSQIWNQCFAQ
jgi:hypothetical protein